MTATESRVTTNAWVCCCAARILLILCADNPSREPDHSLKNDRGSRGLASRRVADINGGSVFDSTR